MQSEAGVANYRWRQKFGDVYRIKSCFGVGVLPSSVVLYLELILCQVEWLMLNDPKAISQVLHGQTTSYHLEESLRQFLTMVTGPYTN